MFYNVMFMFEAFMKWKKKERTQWRFTVKAFTYTWNTWTSCISQNFSETNFFLKWFKLVVGWSTDREVNFRNQRQVFQYTVQHSSRNPHAKHVWCRNHSSNPKTEGGSTFQLLNKKCESYSWKFSFVSFFISHFFVRKCMLTKWMVGDKEEGLRHGK